MTDNGQNSESPKVWAFSAPAQARQEVAGEGVGANAQPIGGAIGDRYGGRGSEVMIHAKAARRVYVQYQEPGREILAEGLQALGCLATYITLKGRQGVGVAMDPFVNWTGARARWKKRMEEGVSQLKAGGYVDVFKHSVGECIDISDRGAAVLRTYDREWERERLKIEERRKEEARKDAGKKPYGRIKVRSVAPPS